MRALLLVSLCACAPAPKADEPVSGKPGTAAVESCHATVATATAPTADPDAGAAEVEAAPAVPTGDDAQAFLEQKLHPALDGNREAIASCLGPPRVLAFDLGFTLTTAGAFATVTVDDGLDASVQPCLAGVLRGLALPTPALDIEGRCRITYATR